MVDLVEQNAEVVVQRVEQNIQFNMKPNIRNGRALGKQRTLEDYWRPIIKYYYSAVRTKTVKEKYFKLKPSLATMAEQHQFTRHPEEDANEHV